MDTSAIIDGRIADIVASGFICGTLVVPRFVLGELQHIADDRQPPAQPRPARAGVLSVLQKDHRIASSLTDEDARGVKARSTPSSSRSLALGSGVILTTDYNLNRVAELQGVG